MKRPSPVIRFAVVVFFILAVSGFVAYRSGWIDSDPNKGIINETPEIPTSGSHVPGVSTLYKTDSTLPDKKPATSPDNNADVRTIMESSKSIILSKPEYEPDLTLSDSILKYFTPDTLPQIIIDSTEKKSPPMFSGSKSGYLLRPEDIKPKMFPKKKLIKHL
jgi:hypothetical protein